VLDYFLNVLRIFHNFYCISKGNHINDSGPQHPSNHNMMGSMCGPGNNGIIGLSNHGSGPMGPGMLINNSNPSMMGGPGSMMNQQGII